MAYFTHRNFILLFALLGFFTVEAKESEQSVKAVTGAYNYKFFTVPVPGNPSIQWSILNQQYLLHPDAIFQTNQDGLQEIFSKRTEVSRYFVKPNMPGFFALDKSSDPIHYKKNGQWLTIDAHLSKIGNGIFEASRQKEPVGFDVSKKASYIIADGNKIYFNQWQVAGTRNGIVTILANADWTHYTAGDDGVFITDIFPGIDAEMRVKRGEIKTNFIVHRNNYAGYTSLQFMDAFRGNENGVMSFTDNRGILTKESDVAFSIKGKEVLRIGKAFTYTPNAHKGIQNLKYKLNANTLSIIVEADYLNRELTAGDVIIDPRVATTTVFPITTFATGSMNCGSATNSCNYILPVTPPAGATITRVYDKFRVRSIAPAINSQAIFGFDINGACFVNYTNAGATAGTVYTPDSALANTYGLDSQLNRFLLPCMPGPSCTPAPINFTLRFWNTYCAAGPAGCSNVYVTADDALTIRIEGYTLSPTAISRSSSTAVCQGTPVTLSRSGTFGVAPYTYSWLPGGQNTASIIVSPTATTTFTSIITDACGNTSTDTTTVNVINVNTPPTVISPQNICQFDVPTPLTAIGTNLKWYTTPTGGSPLPSAPVPPVATPGTYNYYVAQSNACGSSPRAQITVIIKPKPAPPTVISPLGLCQYDVVNLTATGQNLRWYYTPTGGQPGVPSLTVPTAYEDSAYYYVTQNVNGCESDRARIRVFVSYKPNGVVLPTRLAVCEGELDTFNYFGNATPPQAVFNWSTANGINQIISGQGTTGPVIVRFDSAGQHQVRVQVNNRGCLSELASQPVTVRANPRLTFNMKEDACVGEIINVALNFITSKIDSFQYTFPGATIVYGANSGGPYGIRYSTAGPMKISSLAFTRGCLSRPFSDTINVHPLPDASFTAQKTGICAGDSVLMTVHGRDSFTRYFWTPNYFYESGNIYNAWAVVKAGGYVKLRAVSRWGCEASDSVLINAKPCCELFFPNAFSPNNDTHNDVFRPVTNGHQEIKTFRIINRWGQVVYETKQDRAGWNGVYNGREQEMGTYYYYIRYRCSESNEDLEQKGEVILIR